MTKYAHNGGLVEGVLEVGFDQIKYFEGTISTSVTGFNLTPGARRIILSNKSTSGNLYLRIDGEDATATASFVPGDNIKIGPGCTFTMDFDALTSVSLISDSAGGVEAEGILGYKATTAC